jgi:multidrug efflux pump subunit AcrB
VTPAGSVDTDGSQVFVRLDGAYTDIDKIRDTPIVAGQQSFKLSDIADVRRGYEDPPTFLIRHNGEPSLLLSIVMKERWNGLVLGDALRAESDKISSSLPLGVSLKKVTDQAVNISSAVNEFMIKFAMAVRGDAGQPAELGVEGWNRRGCGNPVNLGRGICDHDDHESGF